MQTFDWIGKENIAPFRTAAIKPENEIDIKIQSVFTPKNKNSLSFVFFFVVRF
jgi:hypothetical protein